MLNLKEEFEILVETVRNILLFRRYIIIGKTFRYFFHSVDSLDELECFLSVGYDRNQIKFIFDTKNFMILKGYAYFDMHNDYGECRFGNEISYDIMHFIPLEILK